VLLFARLNVLGVAWLRIASAALILAAWRRPWRPLAHSDRDTRRLLLAWGVVLASMNACFYEAISRLPLSTVAAIEFVPVIGLAALGARSVRNVAALTLATSSVYLLTDVALKGQTLGIAFAFANAALFALYIVIADNIAKRPALSGIDGLAASMLIAALAISPFAGGQALPAFAHPTALLAGIGVGVSSSVIPYITDQLAMARLPRATYALMVSLLPAIATVIGIIVLTQIPTLEEILAVALVITGVAVHQPGEAANRQPSDDSSSETAGSSSVAAGSSSEDEGSPPEDDGSSISSSGSTSTSPSTISVSSRTSGSATATAA
jgi:inner membrane transporter RhtA